MTTYEMIEWYYDCMDMLANGGCDEEEEKALRLDLAATETALFSKADNIEFIVLKQKEKEAVIKARIAAYTEELARLRVKKLTTENTFERLKGMIIGIVKTIGKPSKSGNMQLKTDTNSFTIINKPSALEITQPNIVPSEFLVVTTTYDKAAMRKAVLLEGGETIWGKCPTKESLLIR